MHLQHMNTLPFTSYSLFLLAVLLATGCRDYQSKTSLTAYPLDYFRLYDGQGWILHIEGDGSAYLQHQAVAGHKMVFPPASLVFLPLPEHFRLCREDSAQLSSPVCPKAVYFSEQENRKTVCYCPQAPWIKSLFQQAYSKMDMLNDKAVASRILKRKWLQHPPLGGEFTAY